MRRIPKKVWVICAAVAAALSLGRWIWGWGGGAIDVLDFDAGSVSRIDLYSTDQVFDCSAVSVTEREDIQALIDLVNSFRYAGNELKRVLKGDIGMGGSVVYEFNVFFTDGETFGLAFFSSDTRDLAGMELAYRLSDQDGQPLAGHLCRGSLELFYAMREKYA